MITDPDSANEMTPSLASATPGNGLLSEHVRWAVEDYFVRLDGHATANLYDLVLREVELPLLQAVLRHCAHNQTKAAQILGVSRSTLRKKLTQYGIESTSTPAKMP